MQTIDLPSQLTTIDMITNIYFLKKSDYTHKFVFMIYLRTFVFANNLSIDTCYCKQFN